MPESMDELAALTGQDARQVVVNGRDIAVRPLTLRQIPPVARALGPLLEAIAAGRAPADLVGEQGERVVAVVALATGLDEDWLWQAPPDDFLGLLAVVLEVNADFFTRRLAPRLAALTAAAGSSPPPG